MSKIITKLDSKLLSSAHLNFLFGAGVNGKAFPQLEGFSETVKILKNIVENYSSFEESVNNLTRKTDKDKVTKKFIEEFKKYNLEINWENNSIKNISKLFSSINKLVDTSENRTNTTKQVNIYTLNYDSIVEKILNESGYLYNSISFSNISNNDKFFNMVGYNYNLRKFIPTYLIMKLHGDIEKPILPGNDKYDTIIQAKRFEIIFSMKEKLSRGNSVLFVIGYSGGDSHINDILKDCILSGLTIFWFKYKEDDYIPDSIINNVFVIENKNSKDTTEVLSNMVNELWTKSLEE